ncbi:helix-turn-helix transcriptional regulator (plasmid) [Tomitella fengzijianii]|uniref:Helix-turn-helix transcriptional regulator n=1 Tax=Tomitella fengzijianii TaxID=2597660 RepID=A0A516X8U8_9ACTN|nr:helix-turn-helix transcriptional regulator [Tomitella fengzijianii]QDQ99499.1 helix-turn-helix transcriptional regulator [Tomitella fengzijianii]
MSTLLSPARLTMLRMESGLPRDDLARILGVDLRRYRRWESGKETIPAGIATDLAALRSAAASAARALVADRADHLTHAAEDGPTSLVLASPDDDAAFHAVWPEHHAMPARWWWHVAGIAEKYGVPIERGSTYSR